MKKGIFVLTWTFLAGYCLIQWNATKDTVVRDTRIINAAEEIPKIDSVKEDAEDNLLTSNDISKRKQEFMEQVDDYAYRQLTVDEQEIYRTIYTSLMKMEPETLLPTKDAGVLERIFDCVMLDHPEIFYVDGFKYTEYSTGATIHKLTFCGNYLYDVQEVEKRKSLIEASCSQILGKIPQNTSDYEKIKYIYETLITNTEYDLNAEDNQNICSVFLGHRSVCQGYAKAMQYLLQQVDIPSTLVIGNVKNGEGHAWNLVKADGSYYYVDATWGDAYYLFGNSGEKSDRVENINYDYLLVTTKQLLETHNITSVIKMPDCVDMTDNYYVKEGTFLLDYDKERVSELFNCAVENDKKVVTLKCADDEIYLETKKRLIDEQEVFSFLDGGAHTVTYTDNRQQRSLSFWL